MTASTVKIGESVSNDSGWTLRLVGVMVALFGSFMVASLTFSVGAQIVPQVAETFQTTQAAWVVSAEMLAAAIVSPLAGRLADLYGKKRVLVAVLIISLIGTIVAASATTFGVLIAGRVLQGFAISACFLTPVIVSEVFTPRTKTLATSIIVTGTGVPAAGLGFATGWLIDSYGLTVMWLALGGLTLGLIALCWAIVPASKVTSPGKIDFLGAALLGIAIGTLLGGISMGPQLGWSSLVVLGLFAAGAVSLALWLLSAFKSAEPLIDLRLLNDPSLVVTIIGYCIGMSIGPVMLIVMSTVAFIDPTAGLGYGLGVGATGYALMQFGFFCGFAVGGLIGGLLIRRFGSRFLMVGGMIVTIAALLMVLVSLDSLTMLSLGALVFGAGAGVYGGSVWNTLNQIVRPDRLASTASLNAAVNSTGGAAFPIIAAVVGASFAPYLSTGEQPLGALQSMLVFGMVCLAAIALLSFVIRKDVGQASYVR